MVCQILFASIGFTLLSKKLLVTTGEVRQGFWMAYPCTVLAATCGLIFASPADVWADEVATVTPVRAVSEVPSKVRFWFNLSPFYKKYVDINGLPIVGSEKVSDEAMLEAADILDALLSQRRDVGDALVRNRIRISIMAPSEKTTDIPEHSDLVPKTYWNARARGLGATKDRPASSCAEENLLNLYSDRYAHESICIHELAHTIHLLGLNFVDWKFERRLIEAYKHAMDKGLWNGTYAATDFKEYWAETVQSYFDSNDANNAQHNDISTREKLAQYDPEIFALIDEVFHQSTWRYKRYDARHGIKPQPQMGSVNITITNKSNSSVTIYWLSNEVAKRYKKLDPGQAYVQSTWTGHKWRATNAESAASEEFTATDRDETWTIGEAK